MVRLDREEEEMASVCGSGIGTGTGGSRRLSKVATSLRQIDKQESTRRSLYSTGSHGSDGSLDPEDDDDDDDDDVIADIGSGTPSSRLGGLGGKSKSSRANIDLTSSIVNLQYDLHASSTHFGGLENMGDLQDLDAEELDRMHNKKASLELHTLAESGTGATALPLPALTVAAAARAVPPATMHPKCFR